MPHTSPLRDPIMRQVAEIIAARTDLPVGAVEQAITAAGDDDLYAQYIAPGIDHVQRLIAATLAQPAAPTAGDRRAARPGTSPDARGPGNRPVVPVIGA